LQLYYDLPNNKFPFIFYPFKTGIKKHPKYPIVTSILSYGGKNTIS